MMVNLSEMVFIGANGLRFVMRYVQINRILIQEPGRVDYHVPDDLVWEGLFQSFVRESTDPIF